MIYRKEVRDFEPYGALSAAARMDTNVQDELSHMQIPGSNASDAGFCFPLFCPDFSFIQLFDAEDVSW